MYTYDECYKISTNIIKYYELLTELEYLGENNTEYYQSINQKLRRLLIDEYNLINQLTQKETNECINKINENPNRIMDKVHSRLRRRFKTHLIILKNQSIRGKEINISGIPTNMKFDIYDVLESMIRIETLKKIKEKITKLSPQCRKDIKFVKSLQTELNASKISVLSQFSTTEIIGVSFNMNLNKLPQIDMEIISNNFKKVFTKSSTIEGMDMLNHIIYYMAEKNIAYLSEITIIQNNPIDVYQYLYRITELEVLISYMNKTALTRFSDYCNSTKCINPASLENTKRLIKEKLQDNNRN